MKKNLLIALGDSWTYGHGAYDDVSLAKFQEHKSIGQLHEDTRAYMRANSWPMQLAGLLDYQVINMGQGGSANSTHAKWLINSDRLDILNAREQYDNVVVIWLLSEPSRFSLYSSHKQAEANILNIHTSAILAGIIDRGPDVKKFAELYFQLANYTDCIRDTMFHIKAVENYCVANGYKFLFGNAFSPVSYDSPHNLHNGQPYQTMGEFLAHDDYAALMSPVCCHPNTRGYRAIAGELRRILLLGGLV